MLAGVVGSGGRVWLRTKEIKAMKKNSCQISCQPGVGEGKTSALSGGQVHR